MTTGTLNHFDFREAKEKVCLTCAYLTDTGTAYSVMSIRSTQ